MTISNVVKKGSVIIKNLKEQDLNTANLFLVLDPLPMDLDPAKAANKEVNKDEVISLIYRDDVKRMIVAEIKWHNDHPAIKVIWDNYFKLICNSETKEQKAAVVLMNLFAEAGEILTEANK